MPWEHPPLGARGLWRRQAKWRNGPRPQDGDEETDISVSAPTFPEGSGGHFAQKHQQKGHSDASGISWWKWGGFSGAF